MTYPCFLIEPVLADESPEWPRDYDDWIPGKYIVGWTRKDTGEQYEHNSTFGVGAMWYAVWQPKNWDWENETEPHLLVRCPNPDASHPRDWDIDSRCSNCGLPEDKTHRCWVRHGVPPFITVDKNGHTCKAGGGSIQLPNWHGVLQNGILVPR